MKEELNEKQKLFCLEYLKDFNATRAYKKVYWVSQKSAEALWCKLLSNVKVSEYLSDKAQKKVLYLSNVNSALEKLWKYHKLFTDKVEQSGDLNINVISYKKDSWQN